jgi:hypothetical protein
MVDRRIPKSTLGTTATAYRGPLVSLPRPWLSPGLLRLTFCPLWTNARCFFGFGLRWCTRITLAGELPWGGQAIVSL